MDTISAVLAAIILALAIAMAAIVGQMKRDRRRHETELEEMRRANLPPTRPYDDPNDRRHRLDWFGELAPSITLDTLPENYFSEWRLRPHERGTSSFLYQDFNLFLSTAGGRGTRHNLSVAAPPVPLLKPAAQLFVALRRNTARYNEHGVLTEGEGGPQWFALQFIGHTLFELIGQHRMASDRNITLAFEELRSELLQTASQIATTRRRNFKFKVKRVEQVQDLSGTERQDWMRYLGYEEACEILSKMQAYADAYVCFRPWLVYVTGCSCRIFNNRAKDMTSKNDLPAVSTVSEIRAMRADLRQIQLLGSATEEAAS